MYSNEIETALIGGLLNHPHFFEEISADLRSEHFYASDYRAIYDAMMNLDSRKMKIDRLSIKHNLNDGILEELLDTLDHSYANIDQANQHASIIYDSHAKRALMTGTKEIQELLSVNKDENLQDTIEKSQEIISRCMAVGDKGKTTIHYSDLLPKYMKKLALRVESDAPSGLSTGYHELNELISGMGDTKLIIIGARPAMGKTTFAINLCENASLSSGEWAMVFSLEMGDEEIVERSLSRFARVNLDHLIKGRITESDMSRIEGAERKVSNIKIAVDDVVGLSPSSLRAKALKEKRRLEAKGEKLRLIMVDYIQLMTVPGFKGTRAEEIAIISRSLKSLAKELKLPVVALSQCNRKLEERPNKRPLPSDLKESGAIEQDADIIMMLYRDEVYNEDTPDKGIAEVIIGKNRAGQLGTIKLAFKGQYASFETIEDNAIQPLREYVIEQQDIELKQQPTLEDKDPPF